MRKTLAFFLSLLGAAALSAQDAGAIKMSVQGADAKQPAPVRMSALSADVQVMGNIAVTTLDMTFVNGTDRVLEGEFEFPLGQGESIVGYALDMDGKMRQGVVVEKDKGRQVFEAVVRQGIDPGLVEMTVGNNFKARVYPIPARGSRRVQVTYQSELSLVPGAGGAPVRQYAYTALPSGTLDAFSFRITVLESKEKALSDDGDLRLDELNFGYTASVSRENYTFRSPLRLTLPDDIKATGVGSVFTQEVGKDTFFYYYQPLSAGERQKELPRTLTVWWDVSASGAKRDIDAELSLLKAYIERLSSPKVLVVPFANELHGARVFTDAGSADFEGWIRSLDYDGATNLDYDFAGFGGDEVLVFTDGLSNWDTSYAERLASGKAGGELPEAFRTMQTKSGGSSPRVYTVNSSASANHGWLTATAQSSGGQYINLASRSEAQALSLLSGDPYRLVRAEYDGNAVSDVYPADGSVVSGGFSLSGKLRRKEADVTLRFGHGTTVEESVTVHVSAVDGVSAEHVARQWAVRKVDALSLDYEANKAEITALARQYGIVTQDTSLIVLDSASDYVRYGIVPPKSDAALYAEYERLTARQATAAKPVDTAESRTVPQGVYGKFEEFRTWWNTSVAEFKKRKQPKDPEPVPVPREPIRPLADGADAVMETMTVESYAMAAPEPEVMLMDAAEAPRAAAATRSTTSGRAALSAAPSVSENAIEAPAASPGAGGAQGAIQLQAWSPDAAYLSALKRTRTADMWAKYLELKAGYASSPAFYMEVSDYFAEEGLSSESLRILSNLAELELENPDILRALANKLVERGQYALAVPVFEKLVRLRPEIPQFLRDLGMACHLSGDDQKAVDTLYSVAYKSWDGRFAEVQQIALNDMNAIIATAKPGAVDTSAIDKKLVQNFDVDMRIVLTWNIDNCDVDLWVTDSDGEKCYYGNRLTANGGRMSRDFTQGYGPEEFCIKVAPGGKLKIEANYFGNHQQKLLTPVTVQAEVYTNFGRANQKREVLTLQLDSVKQTFFIGEVEF